MIKGKPKKVRQDVVIQSPEDVIEEMLYDLENGKEKGSTTHIPDIDKCWKWRAGEVNLWSGYANEGKATHIETDIPTPGGWKKMKDLQVGDQVFDENGNICNVVAATEIMYGRPCYKMTFIDNTEIIVDANHQWLVDDIQSRGSKGRANRRGNLKKHGTDQQYKRRVAQIKTTEQMLQDVKIGNKNNYSVNVCSALNLPYRELEIPPYTLGAWLGDGHSNGGGITGIDAEIFDRIEAEGIVLSKRASSKERGILKFTVKLRKLGLLNNKRIPIEYLRASVDQRLELLKGLMDTDGHIDTYGRCEFVTIKKELAQDVYELMTSLGIKVYVTEDRATLYGRDISPRFRLRFKCRFSVFNLTRKKAREQFTTKNENRTISSIEPIESVPVKCIEVDSESHLYLCTKSFIPTHNSLMLRTLSIIKALEEGWNFLFNAPEDFPAKEFYDDMVHSITGFPTDKDHPLCVSKELYMHAYELIKEHFQFVYIKPPNNTIEDALSEFQKLIDEYDIQAVVLDPLLKFARPEKFMQRDDLYAAHIGSLCMDFARINNVSLSIIMHQLTPEFDKDGFYVKPSMYRIKGGGSWADSADNVLFTQRPFYAKDKIDSTVIFGSQKIKKQKLVGIPQELMMRFNRKTNRYIDHTTGEDLYNFDKWFQ